MITYYWDFPAFYCKTKEDGMQYVVTTVHWIYTGANEDGVTGNLYGSEAVPTPTPEAFTPYPNLSKDQVIEWMEKTIGTKELQENIAAQIELIINPVYVTLPPPF